MDWIKGHLPLVLVVFIGVLAIGGIKYYVLSNQPANESAQLPTTASSPVVRSSPTATVTATDPTLGKNKTYFAKGSAGKYTLLDITTGESKDFTPTGYTIVNSLGYSQFPSYLVLIKEQQLYAYNALSKETKKINIDPLAAKQQAFPSPSLSEKDKLYIEIATIDDSNELGASITTESKGYFYDFTSSKLTEAQDSKIPSTKGGSTCYQYDSKYTRFFIWLCGEGIGNGTPLTVYDYVAKTTKEIATGNVPKYSHLEYSSNNGEFLIMPDAGSDGAGGSYLGKIIRVKTDKNITQEVYTVSDKIKSQTAGSVYSAMFIDGKNLLAIGGSKSILLLGYDSSKQLVSADSISEPNLYANFMFSDSQKIYYKSTDKIKALNLDTKQVEKSFTVNKNDQEITLISLPE